ncbi:Putative nucleoside-diphosphate sugar epimerase [Gloeomargarita lithophora Alchichica-D10]|uniref:Nucleoside-diphosphate sugar epimerase n=1 Tax=Gloeomargarita lithophora Alchichica-D10 TaxID=1188229 RepID=A0A1J0AHB0_9CYAN|nr:TIGR01777 family oxidoreductase [Gloeomargarita lithophora]APB35329.1 Putative nucleoside-diphosphate sugar epimerase [Gloeomargarita lithophora Alchichica-D10]
MAVLVLGGTGFIGSQLVTQLQQRGEQVRLVTRNPQRAQQLFPQAQVFPLAALAEAVDGCTGVVNLAGEPIIGRWTVARKQAIQESRRGGTQRLVQAIAQAQVRPQVLVNASAIGYYGASETAVFREDSPPGQDFLAQVCQEWEQAAQPGQGVRLVIFRIGIVLGMGGALERILPPFRAFLGGPIGSGQQWFSWIHQTDMVNLLLAALDDPAWTGVYNATAPQPVRMAQLCQTLGQVLQRPSWLPVPGMVLELLLGDAAQVILTGQQVLPQRVQAMGFCYQYPTLTPALENLFHPGLS